MDKKRKKQLESVQHPEANDGQVNTVRTRDGIHQFSFRPFLHCLLAPLQCCSLSFADWRRKLQSHDALLPDKVLRLWDRRDISVL